MVTRRLSWKKALQPGCRRLLRAKRLEAAGVVCWHVRRATKHVADRFLSKDAPRANSTQRTIDTKRRAAALGTCTKRHPRICDVNTPARLNSRESHPALELIHHLFQLLEIYMLGAREIMRPADLPRAASHDFVNHRVLRDQHALTQGRAIKANMATSVLGAFVQCLSQFLFDLALHGAP